MIEFTTGDILKAQTEALVNTVNCVGIMGRGIALQFKKVFPENFVVYEAACKRNEVVPGRMLVFETGTITNPKYIINFPTKRHWRGKSRIEDIESGLRALTLEIEKRNIRSIAIPPLGAGLGGLNWAQVRKLIELHLCKLHSIEVVVYEPNGAPDPEFMAHIRKVPDMTSGRAALVGLIYRYLGGLMDPFVSLLEIHKLMYFMQEAGQPLRLRFAKALYGPYAENLRHVLNAVEGHFVSGYADGGDQPDKQLELVPGAVGEAEEFLADDTEAAERLARVSDLVSGFETPFGLELLSTVHWVALREEATDKADVVRKVYGWNDRKRRFSPEQIELALSTLRAKRWLPTP